MNSINTDYYPFGMLVPNRNYSVSDDYRYGFQGQEKDDEVKGKGNSLNYKYRMHDPRIGRFFAVDPLAGKYPHYSPYSFSGNKVIASVELEGLEDKDYLKEFLHKGTEILLNKAKDITLSYTNFVWNNIKRTTKDYIESKELVVTANIHARYSAGGRAAFEIKHGIGLDVDLGSATLLSVDGSINLRTGEFDGVIDYYNKGGKVLFTEKVSTSIPLSEIGIPIQVSGGWSKEYSKKKDDIGNLELDVEEDIKETIEGGAGALLIPLGVTVSNRVITNEEKDESKTEQAAKVNAGFAGGVGIVGEVEVGVEFKIKDKEED